MTDEIIIKRKGVEISKVKVPDFGEYKLIIQNGKVYRVEQTKSEIIKNNINT